MCILLFIFWGTNLIVVFCGTNLIVSILWHESKCSPPPQPFPRPHLGLYRPPWPQAPPVVLWFFFNPYFFRKALCVFLWVGQQSSCALAAPSKIRQECRPQSCTICSTSALVQHRRVTFPAGFERTMSCSSPWKYTKIAFGHFNTGCRPYKIMHNAIMKRLSNNHCTMSWYADPCKK